MAVEVTIAYYHDGDKVRQFPTGVQIDVEHGPDAAVLIVMDADGKTVGLAREWSEAHIVGDANVVTIDREKALARIQARTAQAFKEFAEHLQDSPPPASEG